MDRQTGEWLYYNFAAGSFHTKKLCTRLYSTEIEFYLKQKKNKTSLLSHPLGDLRVTSICTPSMACWKAHGRLPIYHNYHAILSIGRILSLLCLFHSFIHSLCMVIDFSAGALLIGVKVYMAVWPHLGQVFSHFGRIAPGMAKFWASTGTIWQDMLLAEVLVELFCYLLWLRRHKRKSVEVGVF